MTHNILLIRSESQKMTHRCTINSIQLDDKSISVWQIPFFSLVPEIEFLSLELIIICFDPVVRGAPVVPFGSDFTNPDVFLSGEVGLFSRCSWTICIFLDSIEAPLKTDFQFWNKIDRRKQDSSERDSRSTLLIRPNINYITCTNTFCLWLKQYITNQKITYTV